MNRSRDKVRCALNHQNAGSIPVDFGSTAVTGIHCRIVEALRNYYGPDSNLRFLKRSPGYLVG